jgi:hypothetical protein
MARERPEKTMADYLVIAICPLLIMAMTGSVAFFLLDLGYHGQWAGRLRWTLFWFVVASVLVSRISIEQGRDQGRIYGIALALATAGLIYRLMGVAILGWCLLAFAWWCAGKLTWDCTLVDDSEDASGEGLLQVAGVDSTNSGENAEENDGGEKPQRQSFWARLLRDRAKRKGDPHAPGSWVIYFSILALPVFGVGQAFFGQGNEVQRVSGLRLLGVFVAAALGLLSATSFLGLRRYLRQRNLRMPATIAGLWIFLGAVLAGGLMAVCFLLPRPETTYRRFTVSTAVTELKNQASRFAVLKGEAAQGEGRRIGQGGGKSSEPPNGSPSTRDGEGNQGKKPEGDPGKAQEVARQGGEGKRSETGKSGKDRGTGKAPPASPLQSSKPMPGQPVANWMKWLIYGLIAIGVGYFLFRHRREVLAKLRDLWGALGEMVTSLFGWLRKKPAEPERPGMPADVPKLPGFDSFANPFTSGAVQQMRPEEVVSYTFEALQAWAVGRGRVRTPDQTPMEFAQQIGGEIPGLLEQAGTLARWYTRIAYAGYQPSPENLDALAGLWRILEENRFMESAVPRS